MFVIACKFLKWTVFPDKKLVRYEIWNFFGKYFKWGDCDILHIPHHIQVKKRSIGCSRLRGSRRRGEALSFPKIQDGVCSTAEWRKSRKRREIFDRRRKGRNARARRKRWLPVEDWWTISPQPLRGEKTSTPLSNSHDVTSLSIIVSLLPNNFKSRDALIHFVVYFQVK